MTAEEASQCYNSEQRRYNELCGNIRSYQNKIAEYRSERQKKVVLADEKRTEIQKNQNIFDSISNTTSSRDGLFSHLSQINSKVQDAAGNFSTMVSSSTVKAFNLEDSYGENATNANSDLTEVFELINSAKTTVDGIITNLQSELQAANNRISTLDSEISKAQSMIDQYESGKQSCLANMAYYKKIMSSEE